ncbi:hypothetical protein Pd630_LPD04518 [Rhodococcus opacus PD630]|nr:hypothetical protein Pd630_LPD04518 [Rhodococcus opacus PD630]
MPVRIRLRATGGSTMSDTRRNPVLIAGELLHSEKCSDSVEQQERMLCLSAWSECSVGVHRVTNGDDFHSLSFCLHRRSASGWDEESSIGPGRPVSHPGISRVLER